MPVARPRFFLSSTSSAGFVFPMLGISGLRMSHATPATGRSGLRTRPLLHQARSYLGDATPGLSTRVTVQCSYTQDRMAGVNQLCEYLREVIGTTKQHLWIVDDDQAETLVTSNNEAAGSNVVCEYSGATKKTWLAVGNYLFLGDNGTASGDEVVVAEAHTTGPPHSFTADLIHPHDSGTASYRVSMVYPDAVLDSVRSTPAPMGNSTLTLTFMSGEVPLLGTSLP